MKWRWFAAIAFFVVFSAFPAPGRAVTPQELAGVMEDGQPVTIIDIRNSALYARGHIQGAINIPAAVIAEKRLPPLGRVVVYGDGLHAEKTGNAVKALNDKRGIEASMLEGGFAAWEAFSPATTAQPGLRPARIRYLSYAELQKAAAGDSDIVLVDLRHPPKESDPPLTDLAGEFDGVKIIKPRRDGRGRFNVLGSMAPGAKDGSNPGFHVLIDSGDGTAEKTVRRLMAGGIGTVAILTGGELILRRHGRMDTQTMESGN